MDVSGPLLKKAGFRGTDLYGSVVLVAMVRTKTVFVVIKTFSMNKGSITVQNDNHSLQ